MTLYRRRLHWVLVRAWPLWAAIVLIGLHLGAALWWLGLDRSEVNRCVALLTQVAGVFLVVWSIDSNLATLKKTSIRREMWGQIVRYWREWPKKPKIVTVSMSATIPGPLGELSMAARAESAAPTIDDRVKRLERRVMEIDTKLIEYDRKHETRTATLRKEISTTFGEIRSSLVHMESKVEGVAIGGLKGQLFGLFLLLYGAVASYFG